MDINRIKLEEGRKFFCNFLSGHGPTVYGLDKYTCWVYICNMIYDVEISALAKKQLKKVPQHIVVKLMTWVDSVANLY